MSRISPCLILLLMACPAWCDEGQLAEDPFALNRAHAAPSEEKPWVGRSPAELRDWLRKGGLHVKLRANAVIREEEHPEWAWFRESGLGLFLHWGLPSANPRTGDAWAVQYSEIKKKNKRHLEPAEAMFSVAETWNPTAYDPDKWLAAAKRAGFGYSVLTARHHDGYGLWPSEFGEWDTGDQMGGRDLIRPYLEAARRHGVRAGLYFSGPNWHFDYKNRQFGFPPHADYKVNYKHEFVDVAAPLVGPMQSAGPEQDAETKGQVVELLSNYGAIDLWWWDGTVPMTEAELRSMQPNMFVARGKIATPEGRHQSASRNVKTVNEADWWWESCRKAEPRHTPNWHYGVECETNHWDAATLLTELIRCRSLGGNLLVNIPPRGDGTMMEWYYELCDDMAAWMAHSREAVHGVDLDAPLPTLDLTENFTTKRGRTWYSLPDASGSVQIRRVPRPATVTLLRTGGTLDYHYQDQTLSVIVPKGMRTDLPDLVKIQFTAEPEQP